jgi:hypothetical protein
MIRWCFILMSAIILSCAARAEDGGTRAEQTFAAVCTAAINERPDISSIAASLGMEAVGGMNDMAITVGRTNLRLFNSPQTKQNIVITTSAYSDARAINCKSTAPGPASRADLERLAQSLKLEGDFIQLPAVTTGRWKRPGNEPFIFVTMVTSAPSTVLEMQRIDASASAAKKKKQK